MKLLHLQHWYEAGFLSALDWQLAEAMVSLDPDLPSDALTLVALCSRQASRGHTLIDLRALRHDPARVLGVSADHEACAWVRQSETQHMDLSARFAADRQAPVVIVGHHLMLRRHFEDEVRLGQQLADRIALRQSASVDVSLVRDTLEQLFGPDSEQPNWQRVACARSLEAQFSLITGGPGTGKTTTVVKLLALIQQTAISSGLPPQRIGLVAPTGKAAARLSESIAHQVGTLADLGLGGEVTDAIPTMVSTVHRFLGLSPHRPSGRFTGGRSAPLDWLVVDEASMIDLQLMTRLMDSLAPATQVVLLGDPDQLSSVEAGAVLGQLTADRRAQGIGPKAAQRLQDLGATVANLTTSDHEIGLSWTHLTVSHRFDQHSGIGAIARAVNQGRGDLAWTCFSQFDDLGLLTSPGSLVDAIVARTAEWLRLGQACERRDPTALAQCDNDWARACLLRVAELQVLAVVREGLGSVEDFNQGVEKQLALTFGLGATTGWYPGRPVMVTQNQPDLGLMNGDLGVCLPRIEQGVAKLRLATIIDGQLRWFPMSAVPSVETVYAMTVHKSQGSEFETAALLWPGTAVNAVSRELLYTAITRAKHRFELVCDRPDAFAQACDRSVARLGRLGDAVFSDSAEPRLAGGLDASR